MHGKAIIDWIAKLFKGADAAMSMTEAVENMNEELKNTNNGQKKLRRLEMFQCTTSI